MIGGASGTAPRRGHRLAELAASLGVGDLVDFRPAMPAPDLARAFRAADVVAVPSRHESFGLVALEAQACGVPVVAAAVGGLPIAVEDGRSGLLVPGHDPVEWAARLAEVVLDPLHRARLGVRAREHAARFSWSVTTDALLASYRRAIAGVHLPVAAAAS
jgi:D-inositol-3-phosphate glycosyltransferase